MEQDLSIYFDRIIDILINNFRRINLCNATTLSSQGWSYNKDCFRDFEICFFIAGSTGMQCGDVKDTVKTGEIFILDNSCSIKCGDGNFTYLTMVFSMDWDTEKNPYDQIRNLFSNIIGKHAGLNSKKLDYLYKSLISEYLGKNPYYDVDAKLLLIQIMVEISRSYKSVKDAGDDINYSKYSKLSWEIASYISENLENKITLSELSSKYRLNPRYLNRIFKSVTGLPVVRYQLNLKINTAKKMLMTSSNTITDISNVLNFPTSQYFSHVFKKLTGRTPGEYRKNPV